MKTYARIQDGLVAELLNTEGDVTSMFNAALVWVDVSANPDIAEGWRANGANFVPPSAPPPAPPVPTIAELQAQIAALSAQLSALSTKS